MPNTFRLSQPRRGMYLYAFCSAYRCKAKFSYKWLETDPPAYRLITIETDHQHYIKQETNSIEELKEYLKQNFKEFEGPDQEKYNKKLMQICIKKFGITKTQFNYSLSSVTRKKDKISNKSMMKKMIESFQNKGCEVNQSIGSKDDPYPSVLLIVSPKMKKRIALYSDNVCIRRFDSNYFCENYEVNEQLRSKNWKICVLKGMNRSIQWVVLALAILDDWNDENYYQMLRKFCRMIPKKHFNLFANQSMQRAVYKMKESKQMNGQFLMDIEEQLEIIHQKFGLILARKVGKLLSSKNSDQYRQRLAEIRKQWTLDQEQYIEKFLEKKDKCCFGFLPKCFVGLHFHHIEAHWNSTIIRHLKEFKEVENIINLHKKYVHIVTQLLKYFEVKVRTNSKTLTGHHQYSGILEKNSQMAVLCNCLERTVFEVLIGNYLRTYHSQYRVVCKDFMYAVKAQEAEKEQNVIKQQGYWKCSCGYVFKTGIPCTHLLYILRIQGIDPYPYVRSRWRIDYDYWMKTSRKAEQSRSLAKKMK